MFHKALKLGNNIRFFPASFSSPYIRHNAVRAKVIAPVHNRQPSLSVIITLNGNTLGNNLIRIINIKHTLFTGKCFIKKFGKLMHNMSTENKVYKRIRFFDFIGYMLLLHHTSAKCDYNIVIFLLIAFKCADIAEHSVLGMFPYCAGVKNYKLCFKPVISEIISHNFKHTFDFFTVGNILLATVCDYTSLWLFIIRR